MHERLDQNNITDEKAKRLSDYEKFFTEYLDYFSNNIKTLLSRLDSRTSGEFLNEILSKQKEFIDFCKEKHPEEYESLKTAMLENETALKGKFKEIDNRFFNFE